MDAALSTHLSSGIFAPTTTSNSRARAMSLSSPCFFLVRLYHHQGSKKTFGPLLSLKPIRSLPSFSSSLSEAADADSAESSSETTNQQGTVHVKFVLQKACLFGQRFFIVGDDPILGLWDPANAIPLIWSDGHAWTVELDLPVEKSIRFKFILRCLSGEISWQPGPDRILETWGTTKTIVLSEDWESAENRKLSEEELVLAPTEEVRSLDDETGSNERAATDETKMDFTDGKQEGMTEANSAFSKDIGGQITSSEGDLVLVPGLTSTSITAIASVFTEGLTTSKMCDTSVPYAEEIHNSQQLQVHQEEPEVADENFLIRNASVSPGSLDQEEPEVSDENFLGRKTSHSPASIDDKEDDSAVSAENKISEESDSTIGVVRNDIHWGRKAFRNLLSNLGFTMDQPLA